MLLDRPLPPCTPWPSCKSTTPRRWSSCTRVVLTQVCCRNCAQRRTSAAVLHRTEADGGVSSHPALAVRCCLHPTGPLCSTSLPHRGYVGNSGWAPQAISLAPEDHQTRLGDSVRPASSQVQGHSVHLSVEQGCPCLVCRSCGPTGEGRDRAGPSSWDEVRVSTAPTSSYSRKAVGYD